MLRLIDALSTPAFGKVGLLRETASVSGFFVILYLHPERRRIEQAPA